MNQINTDRRQDLFERAGELGIQVKTAYQEQDQNQIAIHLLYPDLDAFEDAIDSAERDGFTTIMLHSATTWPGFKNQRGNADVAYIATVLTWTCCAFTAWLF